MAQGKFGRSYILNIGLQNGGTLVIEPPFTVEFDITRNILTSANVCQIRIYNLSLLNRNQIRFNVFDTNDFRPISFKAGYDTNLPTVFEGNITQAWSVREGTNMITQIECFDGGFAFANAQTNTQFQSGTPQKDIITNLASSLPGVAVGSIGNYPGVIGRGNTYSGNTADILRDLTNGGFFIDNGKANCLGNSECTPAGINLINSSSGLLGTPLREQTLLTFDMLFEPRVVVGQKIQLQSITDANFNGFYKIISVKHRGMISQAVCGNAITSLGMFYGPEALQTVPIS